MSVKKIARKKPKASPRPAQSAPLNFTGEHVRMAREGKSKEVFEALLAQKTLDRTSKGKPQN